MNMGMDDKAKFFKFCREDIIYKPALHKVENYVFFVGMSSSVKKRLQIKGSVLIRNVSRYQRDSQKPYTEGHVIPCPWENKGTNNGQQHTTPIIKYQHEPTKSRSEPGRSWMVSSDCFSNCSCRATHVNNTMINGILIQQVTDKEEFEDTKDVIRI